MIALPHDDSELVAAARGGDRSSLDVLLRRHYDRIFAVCRRVTGNEADAADAAQEAMIAIVRGLAKFDGRSSFSTWAYRIATNASLDELRRRRRRPLGSTTGHQYSGGVNVGNSDDSGRSDSERADPDSGVRLDAIGDRMLLDAALLGEGDPLNIVQEEPGNVDYSPVWDIHLVVWTDAAIADGLRVRLTSDHDVVDALEAGLVVSGGDGPANPSLGGLRAANAISNCPVTAEIRILRSSRK
ncbi:MAG: sigma-70 family RNA polymerase sigma factor [Ilumatobacteraceae bacterium]